MSTPGSPSCSDSSSGAAWAPRGTSKPSNTNNEHTFALAPVRRIRACFMTSPSSAEPRFRRRYARSSRPESRASITPVSYAASFAAPHWDHRHTRRECDRALLLARRRLAREVERARLARRRLLLHGGQGLRALGHYVRSRLGLGQ